MTEPSPFPDATDQPQQPGDGAPPARPRTAIWVTLIVVVGVIIVAALIVWAVLSGQGATPAPSPTTTPTPTPTATETPRPTPTTTAGAAPACANGSLEVHLGQGDGAAGSTVIPIEFTNIGTTPCLLEGYPGVSFVGDGNGTQLGNPADEDETVAIVDNTLKPGDLVSAELTVTQAGDVDPCTTSPIDGIRVYAPHTTEAVFLATTDFTACTNTDVTLLKVQPVLPAG